MAKEVLSPGFIARQLLAMPSTRQIPNNDRHLNLFNEGLGLFESGYLKEATEVFLKILKADPKYEGALNLLGAILYQEKKFEQAIRYLTKSLEQNNLSAPTHNNISLAYQELGQYEIALVHSKKSVELNSNIAAFHNTLGNALKGLNALQDALKAYNLAISLNPNYAKAHNNQGVVFSDLGNHENAIESYQRAIQINPAFPEAFNNLGNCLAAQGQLKSSLESYEKAIQINPSYTEAYINLGGLFKKLRDFESALSCLNCALQLNPESDEIYYLKGNVLYENSEDIEATKAFERAISINPKHNLARLALIVSSIPKVPISVDEVKHSRLLFSERVKEAKDWLNSNTSQASFFNVGEHQPFYLAYQEQNNKELLREFGAVTDILASNWQKYKGISSLGASNRAGKIKIGIVSGHFYSHPVWHAITKGWVTHLNKEIFDLHLFCLGDEVDSETEIAISHSTFFHRNRGGCEEWAELILSLGIEALLYPEIGMHPRAKELASLRLSPLQIASWGHPETTGMPSITHFISAEAFESENSNNHYTEALIALSGLGSWVQPSNIESDINLDHLGLSKECPLLICPGSPSKYLPQYDWVLVELARQIGKCQFIFFDFQSSLSIRLRDRIEMSFFAHNLDPEEYIRFIPFLEKSAFYTLLGKADIYLDSMGFSGFNTALSAIECNLPIVTKEGEFLRNRLGGGILKAIGLDELVAKDDRSFIEAAVKLIRDKSYRQAIKNKIQSRKGSLFNNVDPIRDLEKFLKKKCSLAEDS